MLLETLDIKKNDVLIYSQNIFDFNSNFKIIFKQDSVKKPKAIDYFEVCEFIRDPSPKILIAYRLLTNMQRLDAYATKYGYFINTKSKIELIYFDPIYALKDITHFQFNISPENFRFKIQQIGFASTHGDITNAIYEEIYSFDLRGSEAQNQNDKVFAQAIFALDRSFVDDEISPPFDSSKEEYYSNTKIAEDNLHSSRNIVSPDIETGINYSRANHENIARLKNDSNSKFNAEYELFEQYKKGNRKQEETADRKSHTFSEFISSNKAKTLESEEEQYQSRLEQILKSSQKQMKARDQVVLKLADSNRNSSR
ncbi:MAG: hypothetical protein KKD86_01215 [Bacteroidetes bacterium]|nr:hypothetical protein [Bacteroidota bacterium]MBU1677466.1 hypothetical protein [Bacteroidota bacterium]